MHRTLSRWVRIAAALLILCVALPWAAFADNVATEGDNLAVVVDPDTGIGALTLDLGTICVEDVTTATVGVRIKRQAASPAAVIYASGATVAVSATSVTGDGLSCVADGEQTVVLPNDWVAQAFGTVTEDVVTYTITLEPTAVGAFQGAITFQASGAGNNTDTVTRSTSIVVTAEVEQCLAQPPVFELYMPALSLNLGAVG